MSEKGIRIADLNGELVVVGKDIADFMGYSIHITNYGMFWEKIGSQPHGNITFIEDGKESLYEKTTKRLAK